MRELTKKAAFEQAEEDDEEDDHDNVPQQSQNPFQMLEDDVPVPNTSIPGPSTVTAPQEDTNEADLGPPPPSTAPAALQTTSPTLGRGRRKKTETIRFLEGVESGWIQVKKEKATAKR